MKTIPRLLILVSAVAGSALGAQENAQVASTPNPASPPPAAAPAPIRIDGVIHVQKLPSAAQLTADAEAEGMTVTRMDQLADRTIVTYRYASGNTRTFAYTTSVPENPETTTATPPPAPAPTYTVIYSEPAPVYYYPRYYYDPFWPGTSFSLGLSFGNTWGRGYYGRPHYGGSYHGHGRH